MPEAVFSFSGLGLNKWINKNIQTNKHNCYKLNAIIMNIIVHCS